MHCLGTQEDAVEQLWDVVIELTNHARMRGMRNSFRVRLMSLLDKYHHPRIRGDVQNWKMMFQVPVLMGGGGLAKSRLCGNASKRFLHRI